MLNPPYKRFLSSYEYPMSASFGTIFDPQPCELSTSSAIGDVVSISRRRFTELYYSCGNVLTILLTAVMVQDLLYE